MRLKEQLVIQQGRLAAMGEMMVKIAHHWRQPLNIIGIMIQDLLLSSQMETLTLEQMEERTEKIMGVLARLSKSIDDFHNLFSPDTARTVFKADEVVQTALSLLRNDLRGIEVLVQTSSSDGINIEGYRNQYLQVMLNILSNARDILLEREATSPTIVIEVSQQEEHSVVTISDNGGGIGPDTLERVFDPYFSTKSPDKATGIGLFMAKIIVEKNMGGTLTVRNTADGAEFRVLV